MKNKISISQYITNILKEENYITEDNYEAYLYYINGLLEMSFYIFTVLVTGLLFHKIFFSVLFLLISIPTRSYAGGIHAPTSLSCFLFSTIVHITLLISVEYKKYFSSSPYLLIIILLSTTLFAPVDSRNKVLSLEKKKKYKAVTFFICLFILGLFYILRPCYRFFVINVCALLCFFQVLGLLQNIYCKHVSTP